MTHRAWYVSAGCPLAVGPGCSRTSDFLLLPQQLTVLLLPVLHVDQQRDEAVLHLFCKTQNSKVFVGFKDQTQNVLHLFIHELLLEQSVLSTVKNTRWLFVIEANNIVEIKLQVIHWPPSPTQRCERCSLFSLHIRCSNDWTVSKSSFYHSKAALQLSISAVLCDWSWLKNHVNPINNSVFFVLFFWTSS